MISPSASARRLTFEPLVGYGRVLIAVKFLLATGLASRFLNLLPNHFLTVGQVILEVTGYHWPNSMHINRQ
jgi:hypothetical protein